MDENSEMRPHTNTIFEATQNIECASVFHLISFQIW